jgi:lysophospholipase L1-like esterase
MRRADRPRLLAALALCLTVALGGCSDGAASDAGGAAARQDRDDAPKGPVIESYVALGDSFTAAPLVPGTQFAKACFRSSGNYPTLLADELGAKLRDVSCGGADTADMAGSQTASFGDESRKLKPQLDAVGRGADLVTVGIGGNDEGLFRTLVQDCTTVAGAPGASCASILRDSYGNASDVLARTGRRVAEVLTRVRRQAPDAVVALVGYPRLIDEDRPCPAMPVAKGDVAVVADLEARLNRTLSQAAKAAGVEYVDMYAVSEGHEICSKDPWVNGRTTDQQRALAFHPFAQG